MHRIKKQTPLWKKPTLWDLKLCALGQGWCGHSKCPENAPCLSFGRFNSAMKCRTCMCMQCFTSELKLPKQRHGVFLGHFECPNHLWPKAQNCRSQTVGLIKVVSVFWFNAFLTMASIIWWIYSNIPNPSGIHLTSVNLHKFRPIKYKLSHMGPLM